MRISGKLEGASLLDRARTVAATAGRHADEVDREGRFPKESVQGLKSERLLGAMVPAELGGEGASLDDIAEACAVLAQACAATAMIYAMHQIKLSSVVAHGVDSDWHRDLMRRVVAEQLLFASATTEGGVGGDLRNSLCALVRAGDGFTVEKDATVISYGQHADAILLTARRSPEAPSSDQVLAVLMKGQYTLEQTTVWDTLGMRGTCSDGWLLKASAPCVQILPKPFADIAAQSMLATSHILWSSLWYGIAADAVARAQSFVKAEARKKPNMTPVGAPRLADALGLLQETKAAILDALQRYETARSSQDALSGVGFAVAINNLKLTASRHVLQIVDHAMLVCGIMGYKNGTPFSLGRHLRDAHSARIMISNDRIQSNTANLLLIHRQDPGLRS